LDEQDQRISEFLKRARTGDGSALGQLLQQLRPWLLDMARQQIDPRLRARLDESDLVQQTCLSIHRQMVRFDGSDPAQFMAWLKLVHENNIKNAARDQLKRQKRAAGREQSLASLADLPAAALEPSPSGQLAHLLEMNELTVHLESLPDQERKALQLRYFDGLKLSEVAERMGITKDAAVWLIQCGLKRLRRKMGTSDSSD
jgi:RNA polymerase sigma-70 factor (ECF subfamily)